MKTILTIILATVSLSVFSQNLDSLNQKILKMDLAINSIHYNMDKSHKQFRTGSMFLLAGLVASAVGTFVVNNNTPDDPKNINKPVLLSVGIGLTAVGGIIQLDSHKWIGRGGRRFK